LTPARVLLRDTEIVVTAQLDTEGQRKISHSSRGWAACSGIIPGKARREIWAQMRTQVLLRDRHYAILNM
jgi:hypothetical protein